MSTLAFSLTHPWPVLMGALVILLTYTRSVLEWTKRSQGRSLPPGPQALPIVGNLYNAPYFKTWEGYRELCGKYGEQ